MQQSRASQIAEPTPIFGAYRRGYDPEQVDRYVADQQRRLDEAQLRASEAERKLAAAVGQLRELHRRVGVLEENQQRPSQAIRVDGVGEHIQRMFEEARAGAEAMRQGAETEMSELRQKTIGEARSIVAGARKKAEEIGLETDRRRREELERLDEDRSRTATQLSYLHEQRKNAVGELLRIREVIDSTIAEVSADLKPGTSSQKTHSKEAVEPPLPRLDPGRGRLPTRSVPAEEDPYALTATEMEQIDSLLDSVGSEMGEDREVSTARLVRAHREKISVSSHASAPRRRASAERPSLAAAGVFDYEDQ
jgi:cell division septum initiation protein DivIVA